MTQYYNPDVDRIIDIEDDPIGNNIKVKYIEPTYQTKLSVSKDKINSFIDRLIKHGWKKNV